MRTPDDILKAQASYFDNLTETELSALPEGYIAGGDISIINTDVFIGPLIANVGGKRIVKTQSTNVMDMKWQAPRITLNYFHIYLNRYGYWFVTSNEPVLIPGLYGLYQEESKERYIGTVYVDANATFSKVISWKKIRAEDLDVGTITAEEIDVATLYIGGDITPLSELEKGTIPFAAWYANLLSVSETTLTSSSSITEVSSYSENIYNAPYGVTGVLKYDLSTFPVSFAAYTIINRYNDEWQYITSGGISSATNIEVSGNIVTLWSGLPYILPFTLSSYPEGFREVMFIPTSYTQSEIDILILTAETFIQESTYPSLQLNANGLLWQSGDSYIRLGETASFHGVDLDSGNFVAGSAGWQITKEGDVEFNDGTFRGTLEANEVSAGGVHSPNFVTGVSGWNVDSDGSVEFDDGVFRGDITGATGRFDALLGDTNNFTSDDTTSPVLTFDFTAYTFASGFRQSGLIVSSSFANTSGGSNEDHSSLVLFYKDGGVVISQGGSSLCNVTVSGKVITFTWTGTFTSTGTIDPHVAWLNNSVVVMNQLAVF